jgi:hypothetical protein
MRWDSGSTERETCPSTTLSTTCLTCNIPGLDLGLHGKRTVTNYLSHRTSSQKQQQMLLDKYLNTQFIPHRKQNYLNYKDHKINDAYKTNCCLLSII